MGMIVNPGSRGNKAVWVRDGRPKQIVGAREDVQSLMLIFADSRLLTIRDGYMLSSPPAQIANPPMTTLATVLKDEIRRLARKEAKAQVSELKAASARYRKDIAALKRLVANQDKQIARLSKGKSPLPEPTGVSHRFSPSMVKKHRAKLGLSAADYAQLVDVSMITIYNWEKGKSRPQTAQLEKLAVVRQLGKREAWAQIETE